MRVGLVAPLAVIARWARVLERKRASRRAWTGWRVWGVIARCAPPVEPGARTPASYLGSGASPTLPRTGESGRSKRSTAYGQLLRNIASPLPKGRRVLSSSAAVTHAGLAPESISERRKR